MLSQNSHSEIAEPTKVGIQWPLSERHRDTIWTISRKVLALLAWLLFHVSTSSMAADNRVQDQTLKEPGIRALLIGVTAYPGLPKKHHLRGPSNDVDLLATSLHQRFGVRGERIVKLVEGSKSENLPTRLNIQREFARLAETSSTGDHVVIFMAGHGSQMPNSDESDSEADGLDEIFLPRDIKSWNGRVGRVENAITDDEIHNWTDSIRETGAFVFFIGDFCHSGTSTRGSGPVSRAIETSQLGIPKTIVPRGGLQSGGSTVESVTEDLATAPVAAGRGDMVALYAAQPHELAYEDSIPRGGVQHGWLSWTLNQILNESNGTLTYRQLADRIDWHYQMQRWTRSTPLMEGTGIDQEVLGQRNWPQQSGILLTKNSNPRSDGTEYRINAGLLQGITQESILAVLPSTSEGESDEPAGYVRVVSAEAMSATVVPTDYQNEKKSEKLAVPAHCKLVYREFSDSPLRIHVDVSSVEDVHRRASLMQSTAAMLATTADDVRVPISAERFIESAEFVLRLSEMDEAVVEITRQSGYSDSEATTSSKTTSEHPLGISLGRHALSEPWDEWLAERLTQIHRAESLRRLATPLDAAGPGVSLSSRTVIRSEQSGRVNQKHVSTPDSEGIGHPLTVTNGDEPEITIRNRGFSPVDITVLYIAADLSITALYPDGIQYNRCQPGRHITVGGWRINNATLGWEDIIIIGVRSNRSLIPRTFGFLADPVLASVSRNVRSTGGEAFWASPFVRLCRSAMYRERGVARGLSTTDSRNVAVHRLSWEVLPQN